MINSATHTACHHIDITQSAIPYILHFIHLPFLVCSNYGHKGKGQYSKLVKQINRRGRTPV